MEIVPLCVCMWKRNVVVASHIPSWLVCRLQLNWIGCFILYAFIICLSSCTIHRRLIVDVTMKSLWPFHFRPHSPPKVTHFRKPLIITPHPNDMIWSDDDLYNIVFHELSALSEVKCIYFKDYGELILASCVLSHFIDVNYYDPLLFVEKCMR